MLSGILYKRYLAAVFVTGCFFMLSCENDRKEIDDWTAKKTTVEEAKKIEAYLSQEGRMRAKMVAPLMYRYETDTIYTEFPKSLHVDFFDDSLRIESQLNAQYGKHYETLNKIYLRDSVIIFNMEGDTLRCPELWWDQNLEKFYTDKPARYNKLNENNNIGQDGFEATQDLKKITFFNNSGYFKTGDNGFPGK